MLLHFAVTPAVEIKRRYLHAKFIDGLHNKSSYTEEARNDEKFNPNRFKAASCVKLDASCSAQPGKLSAMFTFASEV